MHSIEPDNGQDNKSEYLTFKALAMFPGDVGTSGKNGHPAPLEFCFLGQ